MKINKEDMVDTDGWSWEDYSATHEGKKVVVRVSIEIVRNWDDIEIKESVMDKRVSIEQDLGQISNGLGVGQGLLELNDFDDLEEREEEFELAVDSLKKVEAYIKELEKKKESEDED